jgi:hypothetical protein
LYKSLFLAVGAVGIWRANKPTKKRNSDTSFQKRKVDALGPTEPYPRLNPHSPPPIYILLRYFNVMWQCVPLGTSTGIIMVKKWGDFASRKRGGTAPMEVFPVTTAAGEQPRPRRMLMTRFGAIGALA